MSPLRPAALAAASLALGGAAASPAIAARVAGTVEARIVEYRDGRDGPDALFALRGTDGSVRDLDAASAGVEDRLQALSGRRATLTTDAAGDVVSARADGVHADAAPQAISLLAIIIRPAGQTQTVTASDLSNRLFTGPASVAAYFSAQSPTGMSITGTAVGPYDTPAQAGCDEDALLADALAAAQAAGVDKNAYDHWMVVFPDQPGACIWSGLGTVSGPYTWINGTARAKVLAHELGHNVGLMHANALRCTSGGSAVAFPGPSSCTVEEYGDRFSTMGRGDGASSPGPTFSAQDRERLGWMGDPGFAGAPSALTLAPIGDFAASAPRRVVFPISPTMTASVEYHPPSGTFDGEIASYAGSGVMVYVQRPGLVTGVSGTYAVDAHSATNQMDDSALTVGAPLALGADGATVTVSGVSAFGAQVTVTPMADDQPPTVPQGVTASATGRTTAAVSWTPATDNRVVTDYRVYDNDLLVATSAGASATLSGMAPGVHSITVTARDANRNESARSAPATVAVSVPPRFTATPTASRQGTGNADVLIRVPTVDDAAGVQSLSIYRNDQLLDVLPATAFGTTYTDRGRKDAGSYRVDAVSRSGMTGQSSPVAVGPAVPPPPTSKATPGAGPTPATALSGRLRMRCVARGCTLSADGGGRAVTGIRLRVGGRVVGARNGRLSVRVPRSMMPRLRVVHVVVLGAGGRPARTYRVPLPRPRGLGDVVSGSLG